MPGTVRDRDDVELLRNQVETSSSTGDTAPMSAWKARKMRLRAFLQVLWDSGVACVCMAAVVFSFSAFFVKLMGHAVPVFEIVAFRSACSFTACAVYAYLRGVKPFFGHRANLRFLLSRGMFGAAAMTTYYFAIKLLPLADAVTLFFLNPAVTAVAAWAIMREPLGLRGAAGVAVSLGGLLLLTRPPFLFGNEAASSSGGAASSSTDDSAALHGDGGVGVSAAAAASGGWDHDRLLGSMFGLLSALLSAGAFISIRFIGKSEPALVVSVYFHVCAAASAVLPLSLGLPDWPVWPSGRQLGLLLGVAASSFWGQILLGRGFQLMQAARASAINLSQVVYSYLLGLMFLHESLTLYGAAGSVLIAAGAILANLRPKQAAKDGGGAAPALVELKGPAAAPERAAGGGSGGDTGPAAPAVGGAGRDSAAAEAAIHMARMEGGATRGPSSADGAAAEERRGLLQDAASPADLGPGSEGCYGGSRERATGHLARQHTGDHQPERGAGGGEGLGSLHREAGGPHWVCEARSGSAIEMQAAPAELLREPSASGGSGSSCGGIGSCSGRATPSSVGAAPDAATAGSSSSNEEGGGSGGAGPRGCPHPGAREATPLLIDPGSVTERPNWDGGGGGGCGGVAGGGTKAGDPDSGGEAGAIKPRRFP